MNSTPQNQIEQLQDSLPTTTATSPDAMRMPFKTAYVLTRTQEDALVNHALLRIDQIEKQMGKRNVTQNIGTANGVPEFSVTCDPFSFLGKREKFTQRYYNHVGDRTEPGTIFEHSNVTASLSQRITNQMISKTCAFFFGQPDDDEWFTAEGVGVQDSELADKISKYARYKVKQCKIKERQAQAVEFAWIRGEAVIKTTQQEKFQIYKRTGTFLVDETGEPILDSYGDYILEGDIWVDEMAEVPMNPPPMAAQPADPNQPPQAQQPAGPPEPVMQEVPTGKKVLKRDGVTVMPDMPIWKTDVLTRRLVTWSGPDSRICYYKDFICPLDALDIQSADLIAHLYDMTVMEVAQLFSGQYAEGDEGVADFESAVDLLKNMIADSSFSKAAEGQPRVDFGEQTTEGSPNNPKSQIAECWLTYDADGDGVQEEIMLVLDRRNRAPVFYEYAANVTLRGERPFTVIRPIHIDGRWYGMGAMEYFEPEQDFVDLLINRQNFRDSAAGRVTFWAPHATLEGQNDPALKVNHGKTYTLREGFKAEDALSYVQLPENTQDLEKMIQLFMQLMQIKSGVVNGADQQISGLPMANTATGINEVQESGQELFTMFLLRFYPDLHNTLASIIDLIFTHMDGHQVFVYFNGNDQEIVSLSPDDVREIALHVRLSITQQRDRQMLQSGNIADGIVGSFYQRPLLLQQRTSGYARARLKALRVPQADQIIEPTDPSAFMPQQQQPQQGGQPGQAAAQPPPQ